MPQLKCFSKNHILRATGAGSSIWHQYMASSEDLTLVRISTSPDVVGLLTYHNHSILLYDERCSSKPDEKCSFRLCSRPHPLQRDLSRMYVAASPQYHIPSFPPVLLIASSSACCCTDTETAIYHDTITNMVSADILKPLHPFRGIGNVRDIAGAAMFLASEDASWVTGVCLPVDGGFTAR